MVRTDDNDDDNDKDDEEDEWTNFSIQQWNKHEDSTFYKFLKKN